MNTSTRITRAGMAAVLAFACVATSHAGAPPAGAPRAAAPNPFAPAPQGKPGATIDLTGNWVPIISQDWRWRMITPPKGDYSAVPLNPNGTRVADSWDLARDDAAGEQCKAFGAPAIMRVPGRLRISWQDDMTLKLEFDAGQQTRLLRFSAPNTPPLMASGERTWQGFSTASWFKQQQRRGFVPFAPPGEIAPGGSLTVETTNLKAGYLRKNGVPYSENAQLKEYFDRLQQPDGTEWLVVTTVVTDPMYLRQPFVVATHFKKEPDGSKWNPQPCRTDPPVVDNFKNRPAGFR
ncbi:MAG: hypothetical protein ABL964_04240 [Steroidobacteraceae bacterium]